MMAHWAEIDENNIVIRVTVGSNDEPDEGYQWLVDNLGGTWIKTSYNSRGGKHTTWGIIREYEENGKKVVIEGYADSGKPHLRYNYAGVGFTYDPIRDAFIPPKPEDYVNDRGVAYTWALNEETCLWEALPVE